MYLIFVCLVVLVCVCLFSYGTYRIVSPTPDSFSLCAGTSLELETTGFCGAQQTFLVWVDGAPVPVVWDRALYRGRKSALLEGLQVGPHRLKVQSQWLCWGKTVEHPFTVGQQFSIVPAQRLAAHVKLLQPAENLAWDWSEAIFLEGLTRLDQRMGRPSVYVTEYHKHWAKQGLPSINKSDACAPALSALSLIVNEGKWTGVNAIAKVQNYITLARRNNLGALDHLGTSFFSLVYPSSIWVDSLMMYAVFAVRWGHQAQNAQLKEFGLKQILIFAAALQNPNTGLFSHALLVNSGQKVPGDGTAWLRGNAWVLASIVDTADCVGTQEPQAKCLRQIFVLLADGLLQYQSPSGLWGTLANRPGALYAETSGSALVAYALAKGVRKGWLPVGYLAAARKALNSVTTRLTPVSFERLSMPDISGPTNAGPRWLYYTVPRGSDFHYGVGMYLMAAVELAHQDIVHL